MSHFALGLAIVAAISFVYMRIENYFTNLKLAKQRADSDQRQKEYQSSVDQLQKEIQDAKLTFNINKRKLDSDSNSSNTP